MGYFSALMVNDQWPLVMLKARNIEACNWNLDIKLAIVDWALQHYIALRPLTRMGRSSSVPVVEEPIFETSEIDSISGMRRTGMTWASTGNVSFFTVQGGPNDPVGHRPVSPYKKIAVLRTLQLENLFRWDCMILCNIYVYVSCISIENHLSSHADQPGAVILPLTFSLNLLGSLT